MNRQSGLSLFELIIVMAIVAIAVSVGAPGFSKNIKNARIAAAASEAHASFTLARNTAISRNGPVVVCRSEDAHKDEPSCSDGTQWESGWLVFFDSNGNNRFDSSTDELLEQHPELSGQLSVRYTRGGIVRFLANGMATGTNGGLRVCDDRAKSGLTSELRTYMRQVIVNNVGRVESRAFDGGTTC